MPSRSTGAVYQKEEPLVSDAFSSTRQFGQQAVDVQHRGYLTFLIGSTTRAPINGGGAGGVEQQIVVLVVGAVEGEQRRPESPGAALCGRALAMLNTPEVLAGVVRVGQHIDDQRQVDAHVDAVRQSQHRLDHIEPGQPYRRTPT